MRPPHVAVVYDKISLAALRVYVNEDHEDGAHMFTIQPGEGEAISVVPKDEVRGMSLHAAASYAINLKESSDGVRIRS